MLRNFAKARATATKLRWPGLSVIWRQAAQLSLGLAKSPRHLLLAILALKFGVSGDTDSFFLVYSVVLFISGIISYTVEILSPNYRTLAASLIMAALVLGGVAFATNSTLAFLFVPYVLASAASNAFLGRFNRAGKVLPLFASGLPYIAGAWALWTLVSNIQQVIIVLTLVEVVKLALILAFARLDKSVDNFPIPWTSWQFGVGSLITIGIGSAAGVIDKAVATYFLPDGSTTILSYGAGGMLLAASIASYGITLAKIRDENSHFPSLLLGLMAGAAALVGLGLFLTLDGWLKTVGGVWLILAPNIWLIGKAAAIRAGLVRRNNWRIVMEGTALFTAFNVVGDLLLLPLGVYGLALATLCATGVFNNYIGIRFDSLRKAHEKPPHSTVRA